MRTMRDVNIGQLSGTQFTSGFSGVLVSTSFVARVLICHPFFYNVWDFLPMYFILTWYSVSCTALQHIRHFIISHNQISVSKNKINKEIIIFQLNCAITMWAVVILASVRPSSVVRHKTFTFKYSPLNTLIKTTPHLAGSLKQHSVGRHVAPPLWHLILIPGQSIFALT